MYYFWVIKFLNLNFWNFPNFSGQFIALIDFFSDPIKREVPYIKIKTKNQKDLQWFF